MKNNYLCIDLGGTKTAISIYDENEIEEFSITVSTDPEQGFDSWLSRIKNSIPELMINESTHGCIASPGPLDIDNGMIVVAPTLGWRNINLVERLEEAIGIDFVLINDANAGALGAWSIYKGRNILYVTVSTGIGAGLIINNDLYNGRGNAAELGHTKVVGMGLKCACGNTDCLELYSSGSGLSNLYYLKTNEKISAKEISMKALNGDECCISLFKNAGKYLNFSLKNVDKMLDLDKIIIGGGLTHVSSLFYDDMAKDIEDKCFLLDSKVNPVLKGAFIYVKRLYD